MSARSLLVILLSIIAGAISAVPVASLTWVAVRSSLPSPIALMVAICAGLGSWAGASVKFHGWLDPKIN